MGLPSDLQSLMRNVRTAREAAVQNNYDTAIVLYENLLHGDTFDSHIRNTKDEVVRIQLKKLKEHVQSEHKTVRGLQDGLRSFSEPPKKPQSAQPKRFDGYAPRPRAAEDEEQWGFEDKRGPRASREDLGVDRSNDDGRPGWDNTPSAGAVWDDPPPPPPPARRVPFAGGQGRDRARDFMQNMPRERGEPVRKQPPPPVRQPAPRVEPRREPPPRDAGRGRDDDGRGARGGGGAGGAGGRKPPVPVFQREPKENKMGPNGKVPKYVGMGKEETELVDMIHRDIVSASPSVTWDSIAGLKEAKNLLEEAVLLPLIMPQFFTGIRKPWSGVLMYGPPGTGKTMLAKALAAQHNTTFFNISTSTVGSKWRGEAEKIVRLLFEMARHYSPSTIFIDEIDALCSKRGDSNEHEASRRVKTELLVQMDGISSVAGGDGSQARNVMVLGATNHPWDLDEALRRRLERRIYIPLPDMEARIDLFRINLKDLPYTDDVDLRALAAATEGYSGHDVTVLCRDASMVKLRRIIQTRGLEAIKAGAGQVEDLPVSMEDFKTALSKATSSVNRDQIQRFEMWTKEFGASGAG